MAGMQPLNASVLGRERTWRLGASSGGDSPGGAILQGGNAALLLGLVLLQPRQRRGRGFLELRSQTGSQCTINTHGRCVGSPPA